MGVELDPEATAAPKNGASWLRRHVRTLIAVAVVIVIAFIVVQRLRGKAVPTVVATRSNVVQTLVASGRIVPAARVEIGTMMLGRIIDVSRDEGDRVEAGDLLARIDDSEAVADLARAEALAEQAAAKLVQIRGPAARTAAETLRREEAELGRALDDLARLERLEASGAISDQDVTRARSTAEARRSARDAAQIALGASRGVEVRQAAAEVANAEAQVAASRARLERMRIVAPVAGTIVTRSVEEGDIVASGQVLFEMAASGPIDIRIDPDESALGVLALGQQAIASAEAFPNRRFRARIREIAPAVDPQRGTIEVRLEVADPPRYLRADMTVSVDIEVARRENALVLPADAVREVGSDAPWALVIDDGIATRRRVRLGAIGEGAIEILRGVREGERAIPTQAGPILPGDRVREGG